MARPVRAVRQLWSSGDEPFASPAVAGLLLRQGSERLLICLPPESEAPEHKWRLLAAGPPKPGKVWRLFLLDGCAGARACRTDVRGSKEKEQYE
jgi:hypothetical protein